MEINKLIQQWFAQWEKGDFLNLPITDNFKHTSPFGTINGKETYIKLVQENRDKFLGYKFEIHDAIYASSKACVRYSAKQGNDFNLDVSEWYYIKDGLIEEIFAYYHIGEINIERKIEDYGN
ncbi:nuclear transport factor 2 family protein [Flagellimonas sp. 2504JD1-5]